jgi:hypothetical protein
MNRRRRFKAKRVRRFNKLDRTAYSIYCQDLDKGNNSISYLVYLNKLDNHRIHIGIEPVNRY